MTTHESFKKRVRARMAKTGERYGAARRALLAPAQPSARAGGRAWVAQPELSDERIRENTGRGWDDWVDLIDAGPGREAGHTAIATWLRDVHDVGAWWAQGVTIGYERITGIRLPGQMPDGTFSISRSRTLDVDAGEFRRSILDDGERAEMLPGMRTTLRSRVTAKTLRFAVADAETGDDEGAVSFALVAAGARTKVTVTHDKLPDPAAGDTWKAFWSDWLDALAAG